MSNFDLALWSFPVLLLLVFLRTPIALAMIAVGVGGTYLVIGNPMMTLNQLKTLSYGTFSNYSFSIIPLFLLMGQFATLSGMSKSLFRAAESFLGHRRGGVAMSAVGACAGFGAICGSSLATAATMGQVALPELRRYGYPGSLATGALAAGGTLGILIPPSVALVIYAIVVEAPIIEMFQAAIIPGLLAVLGFLIVVQVRIARNPALAPDPVLMSAEETRSALWRLIPVVLIFGSIILGLGMGLFTPTPAAGVGVFLILAYGVLLRLVSDDGLTLARLKAALLDTAKTASMIYFILFSADILKGFFARTGLPATLSDWAAASTMEPYLILIAMLVILIVLGCFMESLSMILVVVPFFWPVLIQLNGGDWVSAEDAAFGMTTDALRIWFGILALIVVELGLITPPVGLNVFVIKSFSPNTGLGVIFRGVAPFFAIEIVRVALLILLPVLCLYLPSVL